MLEDEMSLDMEEPLEPGHTHTDSTLRTARGLAKLRELLEKECDAQVRPLLGLSCISIKFASSTLACPCRKKHLVVSCCACMGRAWNAREVQP